MNKATYTLIAAVGALVFSSGAFAQANNTLATPSTRSPADTSSGYGMPGATSSESGAGSQDSAQPNGANMNSMNSTTATPAYGINNTLATPSTKSPVGQ
ncbi:hypothetical protein AB1286_31055 [Trinickia sp. NRRL B-1857]|uniref:hypothetical protein n=1 Tax=Trinickia sp. NRRL B-1857 TaxID=3162879 RepID=UPI003D2A096B